MAVTRTTGRSLHLTVGTAPQDGATVAALRLAEEAVERGHRVTVYAYGDGVRVSACGSATSDNVAGLLREGLHGGRVAWIVDRGAVESCAVGRQVDGVMAGDPGDLWQFVRDSDVALGVPR